MNIDDVTTIERVLTIAHPLKGGWYAQEHLRAAIADKYTKYGFHNSYEEIKISLQPEDEFDSEWFADAIEKAEAHGIEKNRLTEIEYANMEKQQEVLGAEIKSQGKRVRLNWSVNGVDLNAIAHMGRVKFEHRVYNADYYEELKESPELVNPTWREVALAFNDMIEDAPDMDHVFLEGIGVDKTTGKGRFSVGS